MLHLSIVPEFRVSGAPRCGAPSPGGSSRIALGSNRIGIVNRDRPLALPACTSTSDTMSLDAKGDTGEHKSPIGDEPPHPVRNVT